MTPVTRRERSRQQDRATTEHTGSDPSVLAPLQDANGAFRAFAQVFPLDRMPPVKALTELTRAAPGAAEPARMSCRCHEREDPGDPSSAGLPTRPSG
jgi:hypothetical protein